MMIKEVGAALRRQVDEVVIPEVDTYRLTKLVAGAGATSAATPISKTNAYGEFLNATATLSDKKVPMVNRIAFVTPAFYANIKQDSSFIRSSDLSQNMLISGQVGEVDGTRIILTPSVYFPAAIDFVITHPVAMVAPTKLSDYKIHENPQEFRGGWLKAAFIMTRLY